jgi:hypothetical protein
VDLGVSGLSDLPVLIEIDRTDKSWSVEKLLYASTAGHPCIWVRWDGPGFQVSLPVPDGVDLVKVVVPSANVWEPDGQRRYPERRKFPTPEMIPSPCDIRYVDPSTLLSDEERGARDERVSARMAEQAARKSEKHARRREAGITRGTPINTPSGSGYERTTRPPEPDAARRRSLRYALYALGRSGVMAMAKSSMWRLIAPLG